MTLFVSHTWTPWHLELGRWQTQPPTLFLVVGMAQRCGTCRSEHLSPLTCPPARPHLRRPSEGLPSCLGSIGARPPPSPWKGTPAPLWEGKLLFISHPRQRAHDALSLACMLLLTTPGLQDLPALREGSMGFLFAFHAHLLLPSQPWRLSCPVFWPSPCPSKGLWVEPVNGWAEPLTWGCSLLTTPSPATGALCPLVLRPVSYDGTCQGKSCPGSTPTVDVQAPGHCLCTRCALKVGAMEKRV